MNQTRSTLTVVCPCFNEEDVIEAFYSELCKSLESLSGIDSLIVFVDDGSEDKTLDRLNVLAERDPQVKVYSLSRNFGHQIAITAGLDHAESDAVTVLDSDLQHPPELIPQMVAAWQEGYDVVSAVRDYTKGASWFKRASADCFYYVFNHLSDVSLVPGAADFFLLSRRAHHALRRLPEHHRFLRGMVSWIGFRRYCIRYTANQRLAGESKYTYKRMLAMALDAVFSFSPEPMRFASRIGMLVTTLGCVYLAYILGRAFILGDLVPGWGSVISVVLILGGVQLAFLGIIGEYLSRVFEEAKGRPLYIFKQQPPTVPGKQGTYDFD